MYPAHGLHKIELKDNILTVEARGPFNDEQVQNYQAQLQHTLGNICGPWGQLNLLHQDCLFTPQAERAMYQTIEFRKQRGVCAIAVVFITPGPNSITEQQLTRIYQHFNIAHAYFINENDALIWLNTQLAMQQAN
ncbi:hypothetical protein A9R01_01600 ['Osedax' symbiont bacterium Rs2_46_30_T18]|nr:hypothetical protein A9R01_01600 ['Osedax' symbiont bacterium Rs2_46_30_T18]